MGPSIHPWPVDKVETLHYRQVGSHCINRSKAERRRTKVTAYASGLQLKGDTGKDESLDDGLARAKNTVSLSGPSKAVRDHKERSTRQVQQPYTAPVTRSALTVSLIITSCSL